MRLYEIHTSLIANLDTDPVFNQTLLAYLEGYYSSYPEWENAVLNHTGKTDAILYRFAAIPRNNEITVGSTVKLPAKSVMSASLSEQGATIAGEHWPPDGP